MHNLESTEVVGIVESTSAAGCAAEDDLSRLKAKQDARVPPPAPVATPNVVPTTAKNAG